MFPSVLGLCLWAFVGQYLHKNGVGDTKRGRRTWVCWGDKAFEGQGWATGLPKIGRVNNKPILEIKIYKVEYTHGHRALLAANAKAITEDMYAQVNKEGNRHVLLQEIADHQIDGTEVKQQDALITIRTGTKRRRETMKGWQIMLFLAGLWALVRKRTMSVKGVSL